MIKMTGVEFKRFMDDEDYWKSMWMDDVEIKENGETVEDSDAVDPTSKISVKGGFVMNDSSGISMPFESFLKKWIKKQTTTAIVIECDNPKLDAVIKAVKSAGGKVVK